jgi:hypothetical protein
MAQDAELKLQEHGQTPTPGKIVAELGFGYWVGLFANRYDERLWTGRTSVELFCLGLHEGICTTTLTGFGP